MVALETREQLHSGTTPLYWTLVSDEALPDEFSEVIDVLGRVVEIAANRGARKMAQIGNRRSCSVAPQSTIGAPRRREASQTSCRSVRDCCNPPPAHVQNETAESHSRSLDTDTDGASTCRQIWEHASVGCWKHLEGLQCVQSARSWCGWRSTTVSCMCRGLWRACGVGIRHISSAVCTRCVWLECFFLFVFSLFCVGPEQDLKRLPWLHPASELCQDQAAKSVTLSRHGLEPAIPRFEPRSSQEKTGVSARVHTQRQRSMICRSVKRRELDGVARGIRKRLCQLVTGLTSPYGPLCTEDPSAKPSKMTALFKKAV